MGALPWDPSHFPLSGKSNMKENNMVPQGLCSMDVMSPGSLKLALANCGDCYANLRNSRGTTGWCKVPIRYSKLKTPQMFPQMEWWFIWAFTFLNNLSILSHRNFQLRIMSNVWGLHTCTPCQDPLALFPILPPKVTNSHTSLIPGTAASQLQGSVWNVPPQPHEQGSFCNSSSNGNAARRLSSVNPCHLHSIQTLTSYTLLWQIPIYSPAS